MGRKGSETVAALKMPGAQTDVGKAILAFRAAWKELEGCTEPDAWDGEINKAAAIIRERMASSGFGTIWSALALCDDSQDPWERLWIQAAAIGMYEGRLPVDPSAYGTEQPEERSDDMGESGLAGVTVTITSNGRKVTMPADEFGDVARRRAARINARIERSECEMDKQEHVVGVNQAAAENDGEPKLIRVVGRLEQITMPTERGKELVLKVVLANNGDNRLALAMMDGSDVSITATERDETPAAKPAAPGECDDQLPLFDMDGDAEEHEGEGSGEENEEAEELAGVDG